MATAEQTRIIWWRDIPLIDYRRLYDEDRVVAKVTEEVWNWHTLKTWYEIIYRPSTGSFFKFACHSVTREVPLNRSRGFYTFSRIPTKEISRTDESGYLSAPMPPGIGIVVPRDETNKKVVYFT